MPKRKRKKPDEWTPLPHHSLRPDEDFILTGKKRDEALAKIKAAQNSKKKNQK